MKLTAIGYIDGREAARHEVAVVGNPARIRLKADLEGIAINENYPDLFFVNACVTDSVGNLVYDADLVVEFTIEGSGKVLGDNPVVAEGGIASALIRTETMDSLLVISAKARGILPDRLVLQRCEQKVHK
jgi:beta-galactosidase